MNLEKLDQELFQPLSETESNMVLGGARGFTHVGATDIGGDVVNDWIIDDSGPAPTEPGPVVVA